MKAMKGVTLWRSLRAVEIAHVLCGELGHPTSCRIGALAVHDLIKPSGRKKYKHARKQAVAAARFHCKVRTAVTNEADCLRGIRYYLERL